MEGTADRFDALLRSGARRRTGSQRRLFQAEVATELGGGSARQAERRLGGGRDTVAKGRPESCQRVRCRENFPARGRRRSEEKAPPLAADIGAIVAPPTDADPELKAPRRDTNLSAAAGRGALINPGSRTAEWPRARTRRDILNRRNDRLKRIANGKPLKKARETDAIFAPGKAGRDQARTDPEVREISRDTNAKLGLGDSARGGKTPDRCPR